VGYRGIFSVFLALDHEGEHPRWPLTSLSSSDLLDALRAGGDLDFMREAMQLVLQALIDLEAS
jgi:hypothetical protein